MQLFTVAQVTSLPLASQYFPACPAWHSGGSAGHAQAADGGLPPQVWGALQPVVLVMTRQPFGVLAQVTTVLPF
jgi:hypothetical protein